MESSYRARRSVPGRSASCLPPHLCARVGFVAGASQCPVVSVLKIASLYLCKRDYFATREHLGCKDRLHTQHGRKLRVRANWQVLRNGAGSRGHYCEQSTFINLSHFPISLPLSPFIFVARMPPFLKRQMACGHHMECFFNLTFHRAQQNRRMQQQRSTSTHTHI